MSSVNRSTQHLFSQIPSTQIPRSVFDRSHGYKTTFNSGYLVPFYVDEVLPGDSFKLTATLFARLATPIVPFMDNLYLETFFFFVPNRLVWDNWQKFNGEQKNPSDSTDFLIPTVSGTNVQNQTLWDYFGLPTNVNNVLKVNALPFRAYNLIFNEWFRDENLQESLNVPTGDGPDDLSDYNLVRRGKRHDYFTSCLPWPQKGPGVEISIGGSAAIKFDGGIVGNGSPVFEQGASVTSGVGLLGAGDNSQTSRGWDVFLKNGVSFSFNPLSWKDPKLSLPAATADLSTASPISINDLRQAFQIQKLYERDARGGTRYTEILRSHFGVISPDARLQRPEYLGGSSARISINPVQQTSATNETTPQGNLAAYGVVSDSFHGFSKSFVEHGYVFGFVNVRADLTYQQGLNRMWSRQGRFDFYWPVLAHLGEQAVLNKEIYAQGTVDDDEVFGYQERYAEYRYYPGQITGKFRSTDPQPLDSWHLAQKFSSLPTLSAQFVQDNPPVDRVVAVTSEPQFLFDSYIRLKCARPMPVYSVPGLVDHF
uniref:Major capsid protein n=1 Tax=Microviridae sp. ct79Q5 TaxID=2826727 RepID=A0A8S5NSK1_9VIRU|nr:MAG TPA: major capsid protein [Microviridae sp. ct79Q5]